MREHQLPFHRTNINFRVHSSAKTSENPNKALACDRACSIKLLKYIISHHTQGLIKLKICAHAHINYEPKRFKKYYLYDMCTSYMHVEIELNKLFSNIKACT